jgi:hypothetical protein
MRWKFTKNLTAIYYPLNSRVLAGLLRSISVYLYHYTVRLTIYVTSEFDILTI